MSGLVPPKAGCDLTYINMGLRFPEQIFGQYFFITTTFQKWRKYGDFEGLYEAMASSLMYCSKKYKAQITGYVFMPNHIHLILHIDGKILSSFMRDFKKFISQKVAKDVGIKDSSIWMPRYDRVVIHTEKTMRTKLQYIHTNPVKANLASESLSWKWSSAIDYLTFKKGIIPIFKDWI